MCVSHRFAAERDHNDHDVEQCRSAHVEYAADETADRLTRTGRTARSGRRLHDSRHRQCRLCHLHFDL